ncbi:hypothetical protein [Nitrospira moscoviensis]|uniref:Alginate export domain-containing protein n=1 Tax=Nitrospira moscoviensis TaxID=42253 RepID=A0A0K2GDN0_NITMO|nr:hypothetical protein [Nitrospira moscoviensis]ALA59065.1 exported protein of unknown function [Nitrospira moscoviensis]
MRDEWGIVRAWLCVLVLAPTVASAQLTQGIPRSPIDPAVAAGEQVPEDLYIMPWIATGVVYDDNVFFSTSGRRQDDVFLRVSPGLQASYQSAPFTVVGNYRFDSEVYNKFTELNAAQQRQFGTVDMRWRPSTSTIVTNQVGYAQTNTPFELNVLTAFQAARFRSERYFVNPGAEYRLDPRTTLNGQYAYSKDIFAGSVETNAHIFNLRADHRIGAHDTIGPAYVGRYFTFSGDFTGFFGFLGANASNFESHALMASWSHEFSADTRLDMRVGPRLSNGELDDRPEALVGLRRRIPNGEVNLTYISAVTTIIGTVGGTRTETLLLGLTYEPVKHLLVTVSPLVSWSKNATFDVTTYAGTLEAAYQFNKYVTAKGSAYFSYQEGTFGEAANLFVVNRNVYWLRLEFTYPSRWQ